MIDSITRFVMAQSEIDCSLGKQILENGYTSGALELIPQLMERAGTNEKGTIAAFYSVFSEDGDFNDPITEKVSGYADGHIVLSRDIAQAGVYPAIDLAKSISRCRFTGEED